MALVEGEHQRRPGLLDIPKTDQEDARQIDQESGVLGGEAQCLLNRDSRLVPAAQALVAQSQVGPGFGGILMLPDQGLQCFHDRYVIALDEVDGRQVADGSGQFRLRQTRDERPEHADRLVIPCDPLERQAVFGPGVQLHPLVQLSGHPALEHRDCLGIAVCHG